MSVWRRTVEMALFEISSSMKPYPSAFRARTGKSRPVIGLFEPTNLDEVFNNIFNFTNHLCRKALGFQT